MLAAGGLVYEMASHRQPLISTASAATIADSLVSRLAADPNTPVAGNALGTVTITEFFDYRCPYCRIMQPTLEALVAKDRRIRLVFKEWPIFGGASVVAARIALAAQWQGKYSAVHKAFFVLPRSTDEAAIRNAAAEAGVDVVRLDHDLATRGREIDVALTAVDSEARAIGFQGTPGLVIGNIVAPGAMPEAELGKLVERAAAK
jgi:protein-disulfide isomerase